MSKILESSVPVDYWVDVEKAEAAKLSGMPFQDAIHHNGGVQITGLVLAETLALLNSRKAKIKGVRPLSSLVEAYFLNAIGAQDHLTRSLRRRKNMNRILAVGNFTYRELIRSKMLFIWLISVVVFVVWLFFCPS